MVFLDGLVWPGLLSLCVWLRMWECLLIYVSVNIVFISSFLAICVDLRVEIFYFFIYCMCSLCVCVVGTQSYKCVSVSENTV